jgi:glycosyltransferase involved in cell wall biosynthesis
VHTGRAISVIAKVKILLCGPPLSAVGGGPAHLRNMLSSPLQDRYRFVHFESGSRGTESPSIDEKAHAKLYRVLTSPFALAWRILRLRPAVVHLNSALVPKAFWRESIYIIICKLFQRKIVLQLHGGLVSKISTRKIMIPIMRAIFSLPDILVVLGTTSKNEFEEIGITRRLVIIPNAIDVSVYQRKPNLRHTGKVQRLVYLGRLDREKGILEAIDAICILRSIEKFRDIELRIAGSGPAREEIEKRVAKLGIDSCVNLVGPLTGTAKVDFLQDADLFLFPSYHEGLPYAVLESLAAGTPVIASRVGDIPDVVIDGVHGVLIRPKEPDEIVRAVIKLGQSQDALRTMSEDCMRWASQRLEIKYQAKQFEDLYENLLT